MEENIEGARPRWGRRLGMAGLVLAVLLVVVYFTATSAAFLKGFILPRAGAALHAEITVEDASISPFSSVTLKNLRLKTTGAEPLVTAAEVRLRYGLMDILRGNIRVDEVTLENAAVVITQEADGSGNLDALLNRPPGAQNNEPPSGQQIELNIRNVALKNASVRVTQKAKDGAVKTIELKGLTVTVDQIRNGQGGKLTVAAGLRMEARPGGGSMGGLTAALAGAFDFAITPKLGPQSLKGSVRLDVSEATGAFKEARTLAAVFECDAAATNLHRLALRFERAGQALGQVRVGGPFDLAKMEGRLQVDLLALDRNLLNLAGAAQGLDFGASTINSTNIVELLEAGRLIGLKGRLDGRQLGVVRAGQATPAAEVLFDYEVTANLNNEMATIDKLELGAAHQGARFFSITLDRPMNLGWGTSIYGLKDSALRVAVTNLNLADWQAVLGTNAPQGMVNAGLKLVSQQDGRLLQVEAQAGVARLALNIGTNRLENAGFSFEAKGAVEERERINVSSYRFALKAGEATSLEGNGAIRFDLGSQEMGLQATVDGSLPELVGQFRPPGVTANFGVLKMTANVIKTAAAQSVTGKIQVDKFIGAYGEYRFQDWQTTFDYNLELANQIAHVHRASLAFNQGFVKGGGVDVNGSFDPAKKTGQFTFKTLDLNENTFRPFLEKALGDKKLVSISLNSSGTANLDPTGENSIKAEFNLGNLVVQDKPGTLPPPPLSAGLTVDAGLRGAALDLRQLALQLAPTARASNRLSLRARVDLAATNPAPGSLNIQSDSLDVTPYYDLLAGKATNAPPAKTAKTVEPIVAGAPANTEPAAITLPFKQFTANLQIGRFYLREIEITNWTATVAISNNTVHVKPLQLALNGAPLSASAWLDLGRPGYAYDVALKADRLPLEPIVNSFSTNNAGQFTGFLAADAAVKGAGVTGENLRKNLLGQAAFSITNMNLQIVGPKVKRIMDPIALFLRLPELTQTPINWLDVRAAMGAGNIVLQKAAVESEAFFADVKGTIPIENVLTNSPLDLPVELSLRRSLADKVNLLPADLPADAKYAKLPTFVTLRGTLGAPDSHINKLALAGLVARGVVGIVPAVGEKAGNVLQGVGNLLTGNKSTNAPASTNNAGTGGLLQGLGGLLGGRKDPATNAAGTNAPTGLRDLFKRK